MRICGFTATRSLTERHDLLMGQVLRELAWPGFDEYVTGAAGGGDSYIADTMERSCPGKVHRLIVPAAPHNEGIVMRWEYLAETTPQYHVVQRMEPVPGPPAAQYKARDQAIVDRVKEGGPGSMLVAFPLYEERRQPRSGTWMTVRLGRKAGILIMEHVLEPEPQLF